ncbi:MAG: hypothetical protein KME23_00545 [Goleter apudmare HA4340-LM2]|jgi:hypothetical protein|nr:hypothetical protein [Goleter apudmare HA4340-LM2]
MSKLQTVENVGFAYGTLRLRKASTQSTPLIVEKNRYILTFYNPVT